MGYSTGSGRKIRSRLPVAALALALLIVVAACGGSVVSPEQARSANAAVLGQGPGQSDASSNSQSAGQLVGPGANASNAPGSVGNTGTGDVGQSGKSHGATSVGNAPSSSGDNGTKVPAASCAGLKNQTGVTDKTITIGNTADIAGPIPGLFVSAQQAVKAYVAYFNATSSICGRKLALDTYDSRTDAGANQTSYVSMCSDVFAAVGSMSAFDSGGAQAAQNCGLPDILSAAITPARNACSTCFGIQTSGQGEFSNETYDFWIKRNKAATQKAAFLYINTGAAATNAQVQINVGRRRGMDWVYTSPIDVADFNYGPYVEQMKSKGVQFVQFLGGYQQGVRLLQAMQADAFSPQIRFFDQSIYDQGFLEDAGSVANGVYLSITFMPFNERQSELDTYLQWLQQVAPGATPAFPGLFAWSAAKLFVQEALSLGGKLTRSSLVAKLRTVKNWTGGGMHVPMSVGAKHAAQCVRFMTVAQGKFTAYGGTKYLCNGISTG
ncbi:MAG: amino acid/amide transporter substrate-binding protein family [Marmoricola sp.]|nr:amino acid/amide transporter substrate-binding protein family [Marmoricola sp.]